MAKIKNRIVGSGEEPLDGILFNPRNWRIHPLNQQNALKGVLEEVGWVQQVIVNKRTGNLVDGHLRCQLAAREGATTIPVVYIDVSEEEEALVLATLDPIAAMAATDKQKLDELFQDIESENENVKKMLDEIAEKERLEYGKKPVEDVEPQIDKAEELRVKWGVETGQLWKLGEHRLICGDCTDKAVVERLLQGDRVDVILTDPPYGIDLDTNYSQLPAGKPGKALLAGYHGKQYSPVIGDDVAFNAKPILDILGDIKEQFWFGANYYRRTLSDNDRDGSWLVWDKRSESSDAGFGSGFELIWSRSKHKQDLLRYFMFGAFGAEASNRFHPTQKPTKLLAEILERWSEDGDVVWDGYHGSGSTLIACERLNRKCRAVEISPAYVAVAIQRWVDVTGGVPELIG